MIMKKRVLGALLISSIVATLFTGCGKKEEEYKVIKIGATPTPHAEI